LIESAIIVEFLIPLNAVLNANVCSIVHVNVKNNIGTGFTNMIVKR